MTFNMYRVSVKNVHILTCIGIKKWHPEDHVTFINLFNVLEQKMGVFCVGNIEHY